MSSIETPRSPSDVSVGTASAPPPTTRDPRKIRRARRKRALLGFWRVYRRSRMGMVGLVLLIAIAVPLGVLAATEALTAGQRLVPTDDDSALTIGATLAGLARNVLPILGVWFALLVLICVRLTTLWFRFTRRRWLVTGWA